MVQKDKTHVVTKCGLQMYAVPWHLIYFASSWNYVQVIIMSDNSIINKDKLCNNCCHVRSYATGIQRL